MATEEKYAAHYDSTLIKQFYPNLRECYLQKKANTKFTNKVFKAARGFEAKSRLDGRRVFYVKVNEDSCVEFYDKERYPIESSELVTSYDEPVPDVWFKTQDIESWLRCDSVIDSVKQYSVEAIEFNSSSNPLRSLQNQLFRHLIPPFNAVHQDTGNPLMFVGLDEKCRPHFYDTLMREYPIQEFIFKNGKPEDWFEDTAMIMRCVECGYLVNVTPKSIIK